jgi:uncharacterized repeat protein (TIGR01451 family)
VRGVGVLAITTFLLVLLPGAGSASAQGTADLVLTTSASPSPDTADVDLTYTISVRNAGPDTAEHSIVVDTPPVDVIVRSVSSGGTYSPTTNRVTWPVGSISAGSTLSVQLVIRPIHPAPGGIANSASATTSSVDPTTPNTVTTNTVVTAEPGVQYVAVSDSGIKPTFRNIPLGGTLQWDFFGPGVHEITDSHGLGIFNSGPMSPISYYRYTFDLSAEIRTMDVGYPGNDGKLVIAPRVSPPSGTTATQFAVTWATAPLPAGIVEDVQLKRPTKTTWGPYRHATTSLGDTFVPDAGAGVYSFRDRIRNTANGAKSRFGPPVSISVTT